MSAFIKTAVIALQFIVVTAIISVVYGFFERGRLTFAHVFNANFAVGAIILSIAALMMFLPPRAIFNKWTSRISGFITDRKTGHVAPEDTSGYIMDAHQAKQKKAFEFLFLGLSIIVITGVIQLFLAVIIRG